MPFYTSGTNLPEQMLQNRAEARFWSFFHWVSFVAIFAAFFKIFCICGLAPILNTSSQIAILVKVVSQWFSTFQLLEQVCELVVEDHCCSLPVRVPGRED